MQITTSLSDLDSVIQAIQATKKPHLFLHGELGAGKTTLLKKRVENLGGNPEIVTSPTYTYMNTYEKNILHIDMRRIERPEQLHELGLLDAIDNHDHVAIERPKRTEQYADHEDRLTVQITKNDDNTRTYLLS